MHEKHNKSSESKQAFKQCFVIAGGAAGLFALTTCTSAALREKDDPGNWALGGLVSGALFGLRSE